MWLLECVREGFMVTNQLVIVPSCAAITKPTYKSPKGGSEMTVFSFQLNSGDSIPALGVGTVNVNASDSDSNTVKESVLSALKVGYRHIDTAMTYNSEIPVGTALQEAFKDGSIQRDDIFVTTKVWADKLTPEGVLESVQSSLRHLQLEYVDALLMHMPVRIKPGVKFYTMTEDDILPLDLKGVWETFERVQGLGLAKAIGVSNFCVGRLQELLKHAKIVPAINQVELHPYCHQAKVRAFCNKMGIHVTCWAPMMAPNTFYGSKSGLDDPVLKDIAEEHGKTVPQICLRWCVEIGCSAIPKSFNERRQIENISIFDFTLTKEDHERISNLPQRRCHHEHERKNFTGAYIVYDDLGNDGE